MKRQNIYQALLAFVLLMMVGLQLQAQDAFYVYRNDGAFNGFLYDEVIRMNYSKVDFEGIVHDDYVIQEIETLDSLYRIPLVAIDSISFQQPEMEFQSDVMRMNEAWLPYVIRISESSITFSPSTPIALLPRQGQVIVAETFEPPFETGFSGRVNQINTSPDGIVFDVEEVLLSDIYKRLVTVGMSYSEGMEESATRGQTRVVAVNTNPGVKFPLLPISNLKVGPVTISCTPTIVMKYIVCLWEQNLKNYVEIRCHQTYDGSVSINAQLEKPYTPEPKWVGPGIAIPTPVPGLYGRVQMGGFFRATGSVQLSATKKFYREGVSGFVYSEDGGFKGINEWNNPKEEDWEASVSIDGSLSAGVAGRLQFGIMHEKLASADITLYVGPEISGHAVLKATELVVDKNLYSSIKDSKITLSIITDVVPGYQLAGFKSSKVMPEPPTHKETPVSLKFTWPINHWYLVPEFDNLKWQADVNGGDLTGDIRRNLLPKVSLGWALYDKEDNLYRSEPYFPETYRKAEDWPYQGMSYHLDNLEKNTIYKAYPMVKLMGVEMRTDKSVDVCVRDCPVTLSDFKVTNKQHKEKGFTHEDAAYDYCFNVSVTATLDDDAEDISDWGYVYLDPNGREALISLKQFGRSKTDDRWAYYRNEAKSTCTLYGYVKYVGSDEPVYGEPHDYLLEYQDETSCPDSNHPHWIDLGLPSGTKWACCNVGATSPNQYGNYYAWGETETKDTFTYANYEHLNWSPYKINYIGSNISGTSYDAATVNWGTAWCMPTYSQCDELIKCCSAVWKSLNGVFGQVITGPNGNFIFLPAAGGFYSSWENDTGRRGHYWSSTLNSYENGVHPNAYVLSFIPDGLYCNLYWGFDGYVYSGFTIRAIHR